MRGVHAPQRSALSGQLFVERKCQLGGSARRPVQGGAGGGGQGQQPQQAAGGNGHTRQEAVDAEQDLRRGTVNMGRRLV